MGTPDIKVIIGIRRSGKSKLLEALKKYINEFVDNSNVIHINYNLPQFSNIMTSEKLLEYIEKNSKEGLQNIILIDEVQMCKNFEVAINGLHTQEKYDIYITGSNAFLMSSDLATLFTGRTFTIEIYPFSFKEFQKYYEYENTQEAFEHYVKEGGMAGSYLYKTEKEKYRYMMFSKH